MAADKSFGYFFGGNCLWSTSRFGARMRCRGFRVPCRRWSLGCNRSSPAMCFYQPLGMDSQVRMPITHFLGDVTPTIFVGRNIRDEVRANVLYHEVAVLLMPMLMVSVYQVVDDRPAAAVPLMLQYL